MVWDLGTEDERALPANLDIWWDVGAGDVHLLQSEFRCFLTFYLGATDAGYSCSWQGIGVIEWLNCTDSLFGAPNDEAVSGHRMWSRGLSDAGYYSATEVRNSSWIAARGRVNRVHPHDSRERYSSLHHFILLFHDKTFECLAEGYTVERQYRPMTDVLVDLVGRLT